MRAHSRYLFTHTIPHNRKRFKLAMTNLCVLLILCIAGYFIAQVFWDDYTYPCRSLRYRTIHTCGWPATLKGWSMWIGITLILVIPLLLFMQDFRNPALGLCSEGLFINQQLIRNTLVPFNNIREVEKYGNSWKIHFHDPAQVYKKQFFLFKRLVKYNLTHNNFFIDSIHNGQSADELFQALQQKI